MKKVAIVLAGCGVFDGSEIRESVLALLAVEKAGATAEFFAPDMPQFVSTNHLTNNAETEARNVLQESARIARGKIKNLADFNANEFDALLIPGGFGAAQNLSTFAVDGANCTVQPDLANAANAMFTADKPIGFMCIAPVIAAKLFGNKKITITIGKDPATAAALESMGAIHRECEADSFVKDPNFKIFTTPAYMLEANMPTLEAGISKMIAAMVQ